MALIRTFVFLPPGVVKAFRSLCLILLVLSSGGLLAAQVPNPSPSPTIKPEDQEIDPEDVISVDTAEVLCR